MDEKTVATDLLETRERLRRPGRLLIDRGAVADGSSGLQPARTAPHDHDAVDSLPRARIRQRTGMVAGGHTDHAGAPLVCTQGVQPREDPAGLEGAGSLEELGLQEDRGAGDPAERGGRQRRGAVNAVTETGGCPLDIDPWKDAVGGSRHACPYIRV